RGQGHEIAVPAPEGVIAAQAFAAALRAAFEARYASLFGAIIPGQELEILTWTVRVTRTDLNPIATGQASSERPPEPGLPGASREVLDAGTGQALIYEQFSRESLPPGATREGPCLVAEAQTTTVVPAGFDLKVLGDGALLLTRTDAAA
ncbi:MAG: hydantoinase/oxoprolinase family protein, partial [Alphaproteobacteria bacterium]|nr:hydantoinase/oxoprolinase family protein [Alphaproteobacteria bacterium]